MTVFTATPEATGSRAAGAGRSAAWLRLVVGSLCQSALVTVLFFALWAALPALIGWQPTTVSSGSMMPRLHVGDVAVARPLSGQPALQQVLLFDDPDHPGRLRLHRFVRVDDQGRMITRGDANPNDDSSPVTKADVHGVAVLRVPAVALPIVWLREGRWAELGLAAGALVLLLAGSRLPHTAGSESGGPNGSGRGGMSRSGRTVQAARPVRCGAARSRPGRLARRVTAAVAATTLLGIAGVVATQPAWAGFAASTTNPVGSLDAATYYACDNAVLSQTPYLYYELGETSGTTAADSSGNGRAGTFTGTTSAATSGVCTTASQTARNLDGSTGYIATPTQLTAPNTFTVQTWFKTTTTRGGRLIGFGSSRTGASTSSDRHVYLTTAGALIFGVQTNNNSRQTITSSTGYNDGSWHLVTASLSTAGMRLFVDGTLVASRSGTTTGLSYSGYWRVGYDSLSTSWPSAPTSAFFAGTVKDVAVYTTALTAQAVTDIYDAR